MASSFEPPQQSVMMPILSIGPPRGQLHPAVQEDRLKSIEPAQPVNRKKALRRSNYNVRTIARDILLATGRHPDMLPLNAHLESLRIAFPKKVIESSDLETVRWDLIDPGDPIPAESADDAKDSVTANDADIEEEIGNGRQSVRASNVDAIQNDGSTTFVVPKGRARVARKKGVAKIQGKRGRPRVLHSNRRRSFDRPWGLVDGVKKPSRNELCGLLRLGTFVDITKFSSSSNTGATMNAPSGRPASSSSARHMSYAEYRAAMEAAGTPIPNGKGRPVGWRKNPAEMVAPPEQAQRKQHSKQPQSAAPAAVLPDKPNPSFECQWKDCGAKLHNLDILKTHLRKVHGKPEISGKWKCWWSDCGESVKVWDKTNGTVETHWPVRYEYNDQKSWDSHLQLRHVGPIAWKLGDGPPGGFVSGESPLLNHNSFEVILKRTFRCNWQRLGGIPFRLER